MARYIGGARYNEGTLVLPSDPNISDNIAVSCPRVLKSDNTFFDPLIGFSTPQAEVAFIGGESYTGTSVDLCYSGVPTIEEFSVDFDAVGDAALACSYMLIAFVTGGGKLTITSSADSYTFSKVRLEVLGYTKLILDLPPTTVTAFERS